MALQATFLADFASFYTATQQAEVRLKGMETGVGRVEASLNRMVDGFSGRKIITEATLMAEAIERGGGTSRLTAAELDRVQAKAAEAAEKMKLLGMEVPANLQRVLDATRPLPEQLTLADRAAGLLKSTFGQFTAANLAASLVSRLTSEVSEFIQVGVKLPAVENSFVRLTMSARQSSTEILAAMTAGTKGMVSNYDLMLSANKAMLLGIPVTTQSMGELASTATTLGRAMGKDATSSLNDLITALGRSSPMILDNLGLTVKVGEANQAYAEKLGKTTAQLTDAEKRTAFFEAAMEAARKKTKELANETLTLGEVAASAWTKIGNVISSSAATVNVGLGAALSSGERFADWMRMAITHGPTMATQMMAMRTQAEQLATANTKVAESVQPDKLALYREELESLAAAANTKLTPAQQAMIREALALNESAGKIAEKMGLSEVAVARYEKSLKDAATTAQKMKDAQVELESAGDGWRGTLAAMNEETVKSIRHYLEAGVSQATLATYYRQTATQVKAVASALAEEAKAQKDAEAAAEKAARIKDMAIQQTSKLWNEYHALLVEQTGTTTDIQVAGVRRWAADVEAQAIRAGTATDEFYEGLESLTKLKLDNLRVDWSVLRDHSRAKLEETAEKARATYEAMTARSGEFSDATLEHFRQTAEAAEASARNWNRSVDTAVDAMSAKTTAGAQKMIAEGERVAASWAKALGTVSETFSVPAGFAYGTPFWGAAASSWLDPAAKMPWGNGGVATGWGGAPASIPSFASGVDKFAGGLAKVHDGELLVNLAPGTSVIPAPKGGWGALNVGSSRPSITHVYQTTINAGLGSDPDAIAVAVERALIDAQRNRGYRVAGGLV